MSKPLHISVDTETWGTRPGYDARSLGACIFSPDQPFDLVNDPKVASDPELKPSPLFYVALENKLQGSYSSIHHTQRDLDKLDYRTGALRRYELKRDARTVDWWYDRTAKAQEAFANPVDLKEGLQMFATWLESWGITPKDEHSSRIWSHGAAFDPPIIDGWFEAVDLPLPWHYRASRDTRTLFDDAAIDDHSAWMKAHQMGTFHHALDDAQSQAWAITDARRRIASVIFNLKRMDNG